MWLLVGESYLHWVNIVMPPVILIGIINSDAFLDAIDYCSKVAVRVELFIKVLRSKVV